MREAIALTRAAWLTAASYRVAMFTSLAGLTVVVLPLYFIARALQPVMADSISGEAHQYFAFVAVGALIYSLVSATATALPNAVENAIGRGTMEMMLGTPVRLPALVAGLASYAVLWGVLRGVILLVAAVLLGAPLVWSGLPAGMLVLVLTMAAYMGLGLLFSASMLLFRTAGPLPALILTASMFLGGVYYPSRVIPSWLHDAAGMLPLTYGLRAIRQLVLRGDSFSSVAYDAAMVGGMAVLLLSAGAWVFVRALERARRAGTLSSY